VLDALPVTHVGKPFKPALRAEAAREAVVHALRGTSTITSVRGVVEDGAVVIVVDLDRDTDQTSVKEALDRFAITWRLELS
jgi:fatty-acyl-CoA synthase